MKFKDYLTEAPYHSPTLSHSDIEESVPSYEAYSKKEKHKVGFYKEYEFYLAEGKKGKLEYAIVDEEKKVILAYSHISVVNIKSLGRTVYQQTLIWRSKKIDKEVVPFMFNQILDDTGGEILSDDIHSTGGRAFWKKLCDKYAGSSRYEFGIYNQGFNEFSKDDADKEFEAAYKTGVPFYLREK